MEAQHMEYNDVPRIRLISLKDTAIYLGISANSLYQGAIPSLRRIRVGTRVLFDIHDLDAYVESLKVS